MSCLKSSSERPLTNKQTNKLFRFSSSIECLYQWQKWNLCYFAPPPSPENWNTPLLNYWTTELFSTSKKTVLATTELLSFFEKRRYWQLLNYWAFLKKDGIGNYWTTELFWKKTVGGAVVHLLNYWTFLKKDGGGCGGSLTELLDFAQKKRWWGWPTFCHSAWQLRLSVTQ